MADVVIYPYNGSIAIIAPAPGIPLQTLIDTVPEGSPYAVVDRSTIPFNQNGYRAAWSYDFDTPGPGVDVDLPAAKVVFQEKKDVAAQTETQPLTQEYIVAISTAQPTAPIEAAIGTIEAARANPDYLAATDPDNLTSYWPAVLGTNPFITPTAGSISVGRGAFGNPQDLNNSWLLTWNSLIPPEDTELYVPDTGVSMPFIGTVGVPYNYDSIGACYNPGNYFTQLRQISTGFVLFEFECPLADVNNVEFTFFV